ILWNRSDSRTGTAGRIDSLAAHPRLRRRARSSVRGQRGPATAVAKEWTASAAPPHRHSAAGLPPLEALTPSVSAARLSDRHGSGLLAPGAGAGVLLALGHRSQPPR